MAYKLATDKSIQSLSEKQLKLLLKFLDFEVSHQRDDLLTDENSGVGPAGEPFLYQITMRSLLSSVQLTSALTYSVPYPNRFAPVDQHESAPASETRHGL